MSAIREWLTFLVAAATLAAVVLVSVGDHDSHYTTNSETLIRADNNTQQLNDIKGQLTTLSGRLDWMINHTVQQDQEIAGLQSDDSWEKASVQSLLEARSEKSEAAAARSEAAADRLWKQQLKRDHEEE